MSKSEQKSTKLPNLMNDLKLAQLALADGSVSKFAVPRNSKQIDSNDKSIQASAS